MRALIRLSSTPAPPILSLPGFDPTRPPPERDTFLPESPVASPEAAPPSPGPADSAEPSTGDEQAGPAQPTPPDLAPAAPVTSHYFEKPGNASTSTMPAVAPLPSKSLIPPHINLSSDPIGNMKASETPRRAPAPVGNEFDDIVELSESDFTPEEILRSESKRKRKALSVTRQSSKLRLAVRSNSQTRPRRRRPARPPSTRSTCLSTRHHLCYANLLALPGQTRHRPRHRQGKLSMRSRTT